MKEYVKEFGKGLIPYYGEYTLFNRYGNFGSKKSDVALISLCGSMRVLLFALFPPSYILPSFMIGMLNVDNEISRNLETKLKPEISSSLK